MPYGNVLGLNTSERKREDISLSVLRGGRCDEFGHPLGRIPSPYPRLRASSLDFGLARNDKKGKRFCSKRSSQPSSEFRKTGIYLKLKTWIGRVWGKGVSSDSGGSHRGDDGDGINLWAAESDDEERRQETEMLSRVWP